MADADRILRILLQLRSDTAGATETSDALKKVQAQAAETGATVERAGSSVSGAEVAAGLFGGALAVAGAAAFLVYKNISSAVEAELKLNTEILSHGNFSSISNYNTSQSQSGGDTHVFVVMNEDELRKRLLADDKGRKIIVDHFRGRRLELGIA